MSKKGIVEKVEEDIRHHVEEHERGHLFDGDLMKRVEALGNHVVASNLGEAKGFKVTCSKENNSPEDIDEGRLNVDVMVRVTIPTRRRTS